MCVLGGGGCSFFVTCTCQQTPPDSPHPTPGPFHGKCSEGRHQLSSSTLWIGVDCRKGFIQLRSEVILNLPATSTHNLFYSGKFELKLMKLVSLGLERTFKMRTPCCSLDASVLNKLVFEYLQEQGSHPPHKAVATLHFYLLVLFLLSEVREVSRNQGVWEQAMQVG